MSLETAKAAVEKFLVRSADKIYISFYGGEPLLSFGLMKQIVDHVECTTSKKAYWNLTTNGTLLSRRICDFLIKKDFSLTVSLDGPQSVHDRYRCDAKGNCISSRVSILESIMLVGWQIQYDYGDKVRSA